LPVSGLDGLLKNDLIGVDIPVIVIKRRCSQAIEKVNEANIGIFTWFCIDEKSGDEV
jgi:hypothetical protein